MRAAALEGTSVAALLRAAAKERARSTLERESRVALSERDFDAFRNAMSGAFKPNKALKHALQEVDQKVRRA